SSWALDGEAEKLHHVAWTDKRQARTSAKKSILGVLQLAWRKAGMVRLSLFTQRVNVMRYSMRSGHKGTDPLLLVNFRKEGVRVGLIILCWISWSHSVRT
ncbi:MAG: hypothetical protein CMJ64_22785, partial [Planctomycetaceae bacterium]|nr:hypothetical protein [Planctomycetaceae bacterium]